MCFAHLGLRRDIFYVYLMYRRDLGYRVGIVVGSVYGPDVARFVPGIRFRTVQEHADKAWILRVCSTLEEASFHEQLFSLNYGLSGVVFNAQGRRLAFDQAGLEHLYAAIDTRANAAKLMAEIGLHFAYPHHRPQAHVAEPRTHRLQVHVTLFSGNSGGTSTPWRFHRVWLSSTDPATEQSLRRGGVATRPGAQKTWRVERHFRDAGRAMAFADELSASAESPEIAYWRNSPRTRSLHFSRRATYVRR
jgi:DNA helicase-2/ATP-dependent DNA helicase PcrA